MIKRSKITNHRPQTIYALCALSAAASLLTGCASSGGSTAAAASNPFGKAGAADGVQVNVMRAFGDSYTDPEFTAPRDITNWAEALQNNGTVAQTRIYALGGAKAASGEVRSFDRQIANWESTNTPITERDLSVVYLGYNDIGRNGSTDNLRAAKAGYTAGVAKLLEDGAANGKNRIFVTQITDWSRNPGVQDSTQPQINDWNNFIAGVANGNPNIIAVDLRTVFDRVYADPARFGFTNVTTEDKDRTKIDALYFDSLHYGSKGEELISRVFRHYLTRAWNWANAVSAGSDAAGQINADIDKGLLKFQRAQLENYKTGFNLMTIGNISASDSFQSAQGVVFSPFDQANRKNYGPLGLALNFTPHRTDNSSIYGFAVTQGYASALVTSAEDRNNLRDSSYASSTYWMQSLPNNFLFSTQASQIQHNYTQQGQDEILARAISNSRSATGWTMENKLRYNWHSSNDSVFTPWVSLINQGTTLDPARISTLYTTDVSFARSVVTERLAGIGLDFELAPIRLNGGHKIQWSGGINHLQSLNRDNINVNMTEAGGAQSIEVIQRDRISRTQLALNARVDVSRRLTVNAGYSVELQRPTPTQTLQVRANLSF